MSRTLLPPLEPRVPSRARLEALESRPQAIDPRPLPVYPVAAADAPPALWRINTTSAAFVTAYRAVAPTLSHPALIARFGFTTEAGTTGEARVTATSPSGTVTSDVLPLGILYSSIDALGWQHGLPLWEDGDVTIDLEIRRTAGANLVSAYYGIIMLNDPRGCTAGGGDWYLGGWVPSW